MAPRTARRCPHCDAALDRAATFCDQCGNTIPAIGATQILPVDRPPTYRGSPIRWVITIVTIGVVLGLGGVVWSRLSQGSSTVVNVAIATPIASATLDLSPQQTQVSLQQTQVALQQTQVALQATKQPLAYSTSIAVPVLYSGKIPFSVTDNPTSLNPILGWSPGGSQASNYNLNPAQNELTLIAGSETWPGMPMIIYPYKGDFDAEITVLFPVDGFVGGELGAYASGIGIKSTKNIVNSLFFQRVIGNAGNGINPVVRIITGNGDVIQSIGYSENITHLRIERRQSIFNFYYSTDGNNWVSIQSNYVSSIPDDVEIFIFSYATPTKGFISRFRDFAVFSR